MTQASTLFVGEEKIETEAEKAFRFEQALEKVFLQIRLHKITINPREPNSVAPVQTQRELLSAKEIMNPDSEERFGYLLRELVAVTPGIVQEYRYDYFMACLKACDEFTYGRELYHSLQHLSWQVSALEPVAHYGNATKITLLQEMFDKALRIDAASFENERGTIRNVFEATASGAINFAAWRYRHEALKGIKSAISKLVNSDLELEAKSINDEIDHQLSQSRYSRELGSPLPLVIAATESSHGLETGLETGLGRELL